MQTNLMTIRQ